MLYGDLRSHSAARLAFRRSNKPSDWIVGGAGGWGQLLWLHDQHTTEQCPVCNSPGPHQLVLSVPSSITAEATVVFARCCNCGCKFVTDYCTVTYSAAPTSEAPLRFYVEQGAGLEFLARSVFVAAQLPVVNYLDVGCGFGFGLDMAKRIFGWNAIGLDPGALATAGRDMLGVTIKDELLSSLEGTYDAIVATEVLEHIAHPHAFLSEVHARLSPTGTFILSTPNAGYLDTESNGDLLMPILSPGYHSVLYTAEGLTTLLRRSGFARVKILETPASLFGVASSKGRLPRPECEIDRGMYNSYLRTRFHEVQAGSSIHTGFGYRLFRGLVEDRAYVEALAVFAELRVAILTNYRLDIDRPLELASEVLGHEVDFVDVPKRLPFCLAGILTGRGSIAADYEGSPDLAASYFFAARFVAQLLLRSLNAIGTSDGELAGIPERAARALVSSLDYVGVSNRFSTAATSRTRSVGRLLYGGSDHGLANARS
jgi:SAM-dependent methyltransferase